MHHFLGQRFLGCMNPLEVQNSTWESICAISEKANSFQTILPRVQVTNRNHWPQAGWRWKGGKVCPVKPLEASFTPLPSGPVPKSWEESGFAQPHPPSPLQFPAHSTLGSVVPTVVWSRVACSSLQSSALTTAWNPC